MLPVFAQEGYDFPSAKGFDGTSADLYAASFWRCSCGRRAPAFGAFGDFPLLLAGRDFSPMIVLRVLKTGWIVMAQCVRWPRASLP